LLLSLMVELLYATILLSRSQQTPSPFERTFNPILLLKQQQVTKAREKGPFPCVIRGFDSIGWLYALHIVLCATFGQGWFPSAASESEDRFLVTSESGATIGFIKSLSTPPTFFRQIGGFAQHGDCPFLFRFLMTEPGLLRSL